MSQTILSALNFLQEADRLKSVERKSLLHNGGRLENSAEHSWHLSLAVFAFAAFSAKEIQLERALLLALLHDLGEIDAGDTFVYDHSAEKSFNERQCLDRLAALLPSKTANELLKLWQEFEEKMSNEALYVHALDRFLPIYSNILNEGYSWRKNLVTAAQIRAKNQSTIESQFPELWRWVENHLHLAHPAN